MLQKTLTIGTRDICGRYCHKNILSPHRTRVAQVLSVTYTGLVQHTFQKLLAGCHFVSCVLQSLQWYACCLQQNRCLSRPCSLHCVKIGLPRVRKLLFCVVVPDTATRGVLNRCTYRKVSCRCYLTSFLLAWVCRIAANDGLGIVTVSPPANSCRQLVKHQFHPACRSHLSAIVSSIAVLSFLIYNRKALLLYASYTLLQWRKHHNDASSFLPFERRVSPTSVKRRPFSPT